VFSIGSAEEINEDPIARERLVKIQQAGKELAGVVVNYEVWISEVSL
jgi:hypothetical protein